MTHQNKKALWLRSPGRNEDSSLLLTALTCAAVGLTVGTHTGHTLPWLPALAGAATCGVYALLKKKSWFYPACLGALVLLLLFLRESSTAGFCQWYNRMGDAFTAGTGIVLPALEVTDSSSMPLVLFSVLTGMAAGLGFTALSGRGAVLLSAGSALLMALLCSAFGKMPDGLAVLLLSIALLCRSGKKDPKSLVLPGAVLGGLLLIFLLPGAAQWANIQSESIRSALHARQYETEYTTLPEGADPDGQLSPGSAPALVVTMEKPEMLYLRGFTGAVLEEHRWEPLDTEILAQNEELLYWLNLYEFDLRSQFEQASSCLETQSNTITIQNLGACRAYRYVPFTLRRDDALNQEDLSPDSTGSSGADYDVFTTVYNGASLLSALPETLAQTDDESVHRYRQAEAAYRQFIADHYLTVPEDAASSLSEYWEQAEGLSSQEAVRKALKLCFPEGAERSPRYATAAVLTLRHFGIPARYAEGYIVPESNESSIDVDSSCAACWAEVYHDGIGWIPMALTPALEGEGDSQEQPQPPPTEPEETVPEETKNQEEPEPDSGQQVRIGQALLYGVIAALTLLLLTVLLLVLRRQRILKKRRTHFELESVREAVTWIFADAVSLLARMGIHRRNGSLELLTEPLQDRFGEAYARRFRTAAQMNTKALFSSHEMTEEDRAQALAFRRETLELLTANTKWLHRIWMQWVLCLY